MKPETKEKLAALRAAKKIEKELRSSIMTVACRRCMDMRSYGCYTEWNFGRNKPTCPVCGGALEPVQRYEKAVRRGWRARRDLLFLPGKEAVFGELVRKWREERRAAALC